MPRVNYNKSSTTKKKKTTAVNKNKELSCSMCGEIKKSKDFYASTNPFHTTGKIPYCKSCIKEFCLGKNNALDLDKLKLILKEIDKPFLYDVIQSALKESSNTGGDVLGIYFKNVCSLPQYKQLNWSCSIFEPVCKDEIKFLNIEEKNEKKIVSLDDFSDEILLRWIGYDVEEVASLEDFYQRMRHDNRIESVQDEIYLKKLAIINLEQDKAGKEKNWAMYKQLGEMFSKFMQDAKLRAQDRTEADRNGGIRNFSAIYGEVEKDDFIPPWSYYAKINGANQDLVDKTIMHIDNFTLRLNKVERMIKPPIDTPKLMPEEIDEDASSKYVDINVDITEDLVDKQEDGEI